VNRQVTRLAVAAVMLIGALIVATTYWQAWAAPGLEDRQDNAIQRVAEFTIKRGRILAGDGRTVLAENYVVKGENGKNLFFRRYPQRSLAAHVVGYSTQARSRAGLERSENDYLTGANSNLTTVWETTVDQIRGATVQGNDVVLTIRPGAQRVAMRALGNQCGAIVVLEPATGRVLVMASSPTYDPNLIQSKNGYNRVLRIKGACGEGSALLNRATDGLYAPGSTFKVVTAAAALESGRWNAQSTFYDPGYCEEYGRRVNNYDTSSPFGTVTLHQAMQYSINSVFCNIGKTLGGEALVDMTRKFGFYSVPPLETPSNERQASGLYRSGRLYMPPSDFDVDPGRLAFGQERLLVTPLQMAMVTATIANDGIVMRPFVVERIVSPKGKTIRNTKPDDLGRAVRPDNADAIQRMMRSVVEAGTGTRAQIPGVAVAGKTGTAETGRRGRNTTSFVAFAPVEKPRVAIAVILENQSGAGGTTAAPLAKQVMQALLGVRSNS
jgi:penicillin-binding protein A